MTPSDPYVPQFVPELHVFATITAGTRHANPLPEAPEGRELERVWTVIDPNGVRQLGPVHTISAFLEDLIHDYRVRHGALHYFSRVAETDCPVTVILDYETPDERRERMARASVNPEAVPRQPAP